MKRWSRWTNTGNQQVEQAAHPDRRYSEINARLRNAMQTRSQISRKPNGVYKSSDNSEDESQEQRPWDPLAPYERESRKRGGRVPLSKSASEGGSMGAHKHQMDI